MGGSRRSRRIASSWPWWAAAWLATIGPPGAQGANPPDSAADPSAVDPAVEGSTIDRGTPDSETPDSNTPDRETPDSETPDSETVDGETGDPEPSPIFEHRIVVEAPSPTTDHPDLDRRPLLLGPNRSAADLLRYQPGVALISDRGRADRVIVRGAGPRLLSTGIDGERLPSTDGSARGAGIGIVPGELLEAVAIDRRFSPDRDADVVGARIDLQTRRPPPSRFDRFTLGAGASDQAGDAEIAGSASFGRRWGRGRLGSLLVLSKRTSEPEPDRVDTRFDGRDLVELDLRSFSLRTERTGVLGALELAPDSRSEVRLRGLFSELATSEKRRRVTSDIAEGAVQRELKSSRGARRAVVLTAAGSRLFRRRSLLELRATTFRVRSSEPHRFDHAFVAGDLAATATDPLPAEAFDAARFLLDESAQEVNDLRDLTAALAARWTHPLRKIDGGTLTFGGRWRLKRRSQDQSTTLFVPRFDFALAEALDPEPDGAAFADPRFRIGPMLDPALADELIDRLGLVGRRSFEEDAADYRARETSLAGFGLLEIEIGRRAKAGAGFRIEHAASGYAGFEVVAGDDEAESLLRPRRGQRAETFAMPSFDAAVETGSGKVLRGSLSRTFARPDYVELVPFELIDLEDDEIERGNPDLVVTDSWNLDLGWSGPLPGGGGFSIDGFFKSIEGFAFRARTETARGGERFTVSQPESGRHAELFGVEASVRLPLRMIARGLSLASNLTWTQSEATLASRPTERLRLPDQPETTASVLVAYAKGRLDVTLALTAVADRTLELGTAPDEDLILAASRRWDAGLAYTFGLRWRAFLQADNLAGDRPLIYQGAPDRPYRRDVVGRSFFLGVRFER